jgi:hypothetical protein
MGECFAVRKQPQQVPTTGITVERIMTSAAFGRGVADARKGVPFDWRITEDVWHYERGRLFGHIAPLNMPLWIGGQLNPKAVALYRAASERKLII